MKNKTAIELIWKIVKPKKSQKCWKCKKPVKKDFLYDGHFWHTKCYEK